MLVGLVASCFAQAPAVSPSFLKSSPTQAAYRLSSETLTVRSSRTTGILASLASLSTSSQPSTVIGAMTIASTPWLMKLRTAAICASCLLSAALKMSLKPLASLNASFIDCVFAARQPDSEPVCANPTVMTLLLSEPPLAAPLEPPELEPEHPVVASARAPTTASPASSLFLILKTSLF